MCREIISSYGFSYNLPEFLQSHLHIPRFQKALQLLRISHSPYGEYLERLTDQICQGQGLEAVSGFLPEF